MRLFALVVLSIFQSILYAQNIEDAARFSKQQNMGSARFVGMAGSFGSLGGEASAVNTNPAGLGVFRAGQFSSSITFGQSTNSTEHYGNTAVSKDGFGRLSNLSIVMSEVAERPGWEFVNAHFSYNQQAVFNAKSIYKGVNTESSLLDLYFLDVIEDPDVTVESIADFFPFGAGLAWGAFLIDTANGEYIHANEFHGHTQIAEQEEWRGVGHYSFGIGGNYSDKLYIGGSIGVSALRYNSISTLEEVMPENDPNTFLSRWKQTENLTIRGNGFQFKLGAIVRLNKYLRLGMSFRSIEYFKLSESYSSNVEAIWKDRPTTSAESPEGLNEYKFRSPYTFGMSFGAAKKKIGAVNIDVDVVDYGAVQFSTMPTFGVDFTSLNEELASKFKPTINARLGIEKTYGPCALRGGYGFQQGIEGTPVADKHNFGLGFGYRYKLMAFDIGYGYSIQKLERHIHNAEKINLQTSSLTREQHQIVTTFSVYFK